MNSQQSKEAKNRIQRLVFFMDMQTQHTFDNG